ncbi:MAG: ribonuclease III [Bacteroidota bacterium]
MFASIFTLVRNKKQRQFGKKIKGILGYTPRNFRLFETALIHRSASIRLKEGILVNNERLEYLGDAILSAVVAQHLYLRYPDEDEGFLTEMRSKIVNRDTLNRLATQLGLDELIVSKVTDTSSQNFKGDAFEALIGALYIDKGFVATKHFVSRVLFDKLINVDQLLQTETNFKSKIIEWSQKTKQDISFESFEDETNNSRTSPVFIAHLMVLDKVIGTGRGHSKKEAEQKAAKEALSIIGQLD